MPLRSPKGPCHVSRNGEYNLRLGLICLVLSYVLSQFYRAFLAVLTPTLEADLGTTPADLSFASGLWFIVFALMQIPVGEALDRIGPKITTITLFAFGGAGGALLFAVAQTPAHIAWAMALIGVGCSPVLMASYYIFAKMYPAVVFSTLAGAVIGFGSLGNNFSRSLGLHERPTQKRPVWSSRICARPA